MSTTKIGKRISACAVFETGKTKPVWFVWDKRKINIKETTFTWKTKEGDAVVMHFSVTDGATYFELSFDQQNLEWKVENSEVQGGER